jgi:2-methylisocitrate lyase-like PEP mutase family enzyme
MTAPALAEPDLGTLATLAEQLRTPHQAGDPLVLVNAWDAASARQVERVESR